MIGNNMDTKEYNDNIYTVRELNNGILAIEEKQVRMYLICGSKKALLFDTGYGGGDLKSLISVIWDKPLIVVNSHGHPDHIGANFQFDSIYIDYNDMTYAANASDRCLCQLYSLSDVNSFDLGDRQLTVIKSPGHTKGSIMLLDKGNRILFCGDNVSDKPVFLFMDGADIPVYMETLQNIITMRSEYDVIYGCHGSIPQSWEMASALYQCCDAYLKGMLKGEPMETINGYHRKLYKLGTASIYAL